MNCHFCFIFWTASELTQSPDTTHLALCLESRNVSCCGTEQLSFPLSNTHKTRRQAWQLARSTATLPGSPEPDRQDWSLAATGISRFTLSQSKHCKVVIWVKEPLPTASWLCLVSVGLVLLEQPSQGSFYNLHFSSWNPNQRCNLSPWNQGSWKHNRIRNTVFAKYKNCTGIQQFIPGMYKKVTIILLLLSCRDPAQVDLWSMLGTRPTV